MQEADLPYAFCISASENYNKIYESCARFTFGKETKNKNNDIYGNPDFNQDQYWEGIERYRTKYKEYVDLGIFKSKEITAESMLFFHDLSIENYLGGFLTRAKKFTKKTKSEEVIQEPEINRFFIWWMNTSGNVIKHKVNLFNSSAYNKDFLDVVRDIEKTKSELDQIISESTLQNSGGSISDIFKEYGELIMKILNILDDNNQISPPRYMDSIIAEITTFADGMFYPTPEEEVNKMIELKQVINRELINL